jgi:hypothetical protein
MTKHALLTFAFTAAATAATLTAQAPAQPAAQDPKPADITVTGCLIQGSGPSVFILDNARLNPNDATEHSRRFLIVNQVEDLNLTTQLNHEVALSGTPNYKTSADPQATKIEEQNLPTLTTKSMVLVADRCTVAK